MVDDPQGEAAAPQTADVTDAALRAWPLPVAAGGDKEERGRVILVAGSPQIPGAAVLAATAALRAGAGKVAIATPASIAQSIAFAVPESRVVPLQPDRAGSAALEELEALAEHASAVLIGPGLFNDRASWDLTREVLGAVRGLPAILDAGAMGVVNLAGIDSARLARPLLFTPHAGEMAGLCRSRKEDIAAEPGRAALEAARAWHGVVVLKGAVTHIAAPHGRVWRHEGGNAGLATSGSGDVLAGIIAGLVARGASVEQAALWAVALHARAGERLAVRLGPIGYLAREIADEIPALMAALA